MGMKNIINANIFAGQAEEKSPLGRTSCRWEGHNDKDLKQLDVTMWTGFISLRTRTSDGLMWKR
jgi:hypothetical protein